MGNRGAKRSPVTAPTGLAQGKRNSLSRPFPIITPQSYLPGGATAAAGAGGLYPGLVPPAGANRYPGITPNSLSYPNPMSMMQRPAPFYHPRHRYPVRLSRRHHSRRHRPVVHIIRADSCSSISTCSTISDCSPHRHHSCSYSTRHTSHHQQQQQQPIILLPIQCQPQQPALTAPLQGQSQPMILPSIQVQQQPRALPPINSTPLIIQPLSSIPQAVSIGRPQHFQAGAIQYVQAAPKSTSSQLQMVSVKPPSSIAPQRVLVNSTNKQQATVLQPIPRSTTTYRII